MTASGHSSAHDMSADAPVAVDLEEVRKVSSLSCHLESNKPATNEASHLAPDPMLSMDSSKLRVIDDELSSSRGTSLLDESEVSSNVGEKRLIYKDEDDDRSGSSKMMKLSPSASWPAFKGPGGDRGPSPDSDPTASKKKKNLCRKDSIIDSLTRFEFGLESEIIYEQNLRSTIQSPQLTAGISAAVWSLIYTIFISCFAEFWSIFDVWVVLSAVSLSSYGLLTFHGFVRNSQKILALMITTCIFFLSYAQKKQLGATADVPFPSTPLCDATEDHTCTVPSAQTAPDTSFPLPLVNEGNVRTLLFSAFVVQVIFWRLRYAWTFVTAHSSVVFAFLALTPATSCLAIFAWLEMAALYATVHTSLFERQARKDFAAAEIKRYGPNRRRRICPFKTKAKIVENLESMKSELAVISENHNIEVDRLKGILCEYEQIVHTYRPAYVLELEDESELSEYPMILEYRRPSYDRKRTADTARTKASIDTPEQIRRRRRKVTMKRLEAAQGEIINIADWDLDSFKLEEETQSALRVVGYLLMGAHSFDSGSCAFVDMAAMDDLLLDIDSQYHTERFFHTGVHASDVTNSFYFLGMSTTGLFFFLSQEKICACILAAAAHDVGHPGRTNRFLVNSRDKLAIRYNDRSVLENFHASTLFELIESHKKALTFDLEGFKKFKHFTVQIILATDPEYYFDEINHLKSYIEAENVTQWDPANMSEKEIMMVLKVIIKAADLGHAGKLFPIHYRWSVAIQKEFDEQAADELKLGFPRSPQCQPSLTSGQIGFSKFVVQPIWEVVARVQKATYPYNNESRRGSFVVRESGSPPTPSLQDIMGSPDDPAKDDAPFRTRGDYSVEQVYCASLSEDTRPSIVTKPEPVKSEEMIMNRVRMNCWIWKQICDGIIPEEGPYPEENEYDRYLLQQENDNAL